MTSLQAEEFAFRRSQRLAEKKACQLHRSEIVEKIKSTSSALLDLDVDTPKRRSSPSCLRKKKEEEEEEEEEEEAPFGPWSDITSNFVYQSFQETMRYVECEALMEDCIRDANKPYAEEPMFIRLGGRVHRLHGSPLTKSISEILRDVLVAVLSSPLLCPHDYLLVNCEMPKK
jgi:hypothetical protein